MSEVSTSSKLRFTSPLDVIANSAGAAIGAAAAGLVERVISFFTKVAGRAGLLNAPARIPLIVVFAAIVALAWYPFVVPLDVSPLAERTRPRRADPWCSLSGVQLMAQAARFALVAGLLTACLRGLSLSAAVAIAVTVSVAAAVIVDAGQVAMGSQPIGLAGLASQSLGALGGAIGSALFAVLRGTRYAAA